jgi:hypothetical protein
MSAYDVIASAAARVGRPRAATGNVAVASRLARAHAVMSQVTGSIDNTLAVASLLARPEPIERADTDIQTLLSVTIADMPQPERDRIVVRRNTSAGITTFTPLNTLF